jgi:hypothetical protein avisC_04027
MKMSAAFTGFPLEVFLFLEGLEQNNSKEYWKENEATWTRIVKPTVQALMADFDDEFGPLRTFRPNRDVRFSKDKSPYKTWIGVTTTERATGGIGSFLQVTASGIEIATGAMMLASDQMTRFRDALISDTAGAEFDQVRMELARKGLEVGSGEMARYKRIPRGYPKEHPRAEFLLWKGAIVIKKFERAEWMHTPAMSERIREVWGGARPLIHWFEEHVGESDTPPDKRP